MPDLAQHLRSLHTALFSGGWSSGRIRAFQRQRIRKLVRHAYERVPFYREIFYRHRVHPDDIRGLEDLDKLPIVERADIQQCPPPELVAEGLDPGRLVIRRTGGSTGMPLNVRRTWFEERLLHGIRLRELRRWGLRFTDLRAEVSSGNKPPSGHRFNNRFLTGFGLLRVVHVSCMSPPGEILDRLADVKPDVLVGYAGALSWIAGEATEAHRRAIRPRLVFTGAETQTPEMRRQISECFSAPVRNVYGAHEFNLVALECPDSGLYHVADKCTFVEVIKDGKSAAPGETGQLVATALHSFAMPFIRYRLGDLVTRGPLECPCGAPGATLKSIVGRTLDCFPMPDGSEIHPYRLIRPLRQHAAWLRRYQLVQTDLRRIEVKVLPFAGKRPGSDALDSIRGQMEKAAGGEVTVTIELAEELPPTGNGKYRYCYSLVGNRK